MCEWAGTPHPSRDLTVDHVARAPELLACPSSVASAMQEKEHDEGRVLFARQR
jgi:hypothetical protein